MKLFDYNNYVNNLPDCYAKDNKSNNYKILKIENMSINGGTTNDSVFTGLKTDINALDAILDIDNAYGETLDLYGEMVNQPRGLATDEQYRILIKSMILRNTSLGDHTSVVNAICATLSCKPSEVSLIDGEEPCTVELTSLPIKIINDAKFTSTQMVAIIKRLLPVCVTLTTFSFDGTFEFGSGENEASNTAGFANDAQTIGGYFGATMGDEADTILPI